MKKITIAVPVPHADASIDRYQSRAHNQLTKEHPHYKQASSLGWNGAEVRDGKLHYLYQYEIES